MSYQVSEQTAMLCEAMQMHEELLYKVLEWAEKEFSNTDEACAPLLQAYEGAKRELKLLLVDSIDANLGLRGRTL